MTRPSADPPDLQASSPASRTRNAIAKRRSATFFFGAVGAVILALTSQWWLPALSILFGLVETNNELIGVLADLTTITTFVLMAVGAALAYLGFRRPRPADEAGHQAQQSIDASRGGRGATVGGDVNQGAVVVGDHNQVEVYVPVTYDYSAISPSQAEPSELAEARRCLEGLPLEEVPGRAALPSGSVMPLRFNHHFVGRQEQLKKIAANLKTGGATAIGEVTVSGGLGGVGKTQLASEFVHRYGRYFYGVYWVSMTEPQGIPAEVASCGGARGMNLRPDFHTLPMEERVRTVMSAWQSELPRLLVFDNCEEEELLDRWLPPTGGCRVLVTSRRVRWDPSLGVIALPLDVLDRRESVALLREHRPDLPADSPDLDAIAVELGDLPLALDLAGRYLDQYRHEVTPTDYLTSIRRPELLEHPSLRQVGGISPTRHDMDVWRTFALSYWRLNEDDETDRTATGLLARAARLASGEPIPRNLLAWTIEPPDSSDDPPRPTITVRNALGRLTDLGLFDRSTEGTGGETFRMHRLVAAFVLAEASEAEAQAAVEAACSRAALGAFRMGKPAEQGLLIPHLRAVIDSVGARADYSAANCYAAMGVGLLQLGAYDEAMPYAERAWKISVELYGRDSQAALQQRSNVGVLLKEKKDWAAARAMYEEVLEAQERVLGEEHLDVAATINNLGALLRRYDLYHQVLPLYDRALRIREQVWEATGPDAPDRRENAYKASESLMNMGALLMDLGRHRSARPYLEQALQIGVTELGKEHERNAGTLVMLASVLRAQGDYPLAVASLYGALDIYQNVNDDLPAAVANALATLGALFKEWADKDISLSAPEKAQTLKQAEGSLRTALDGAEHFYGEDHAVTGGILRILGEVRDAQGDAEDARRHSERAEACRQRNFSAEVGDNAGALNEAGTSLVDLGLYDEALVYLERTLSIREDSLGKRNLDTSTSLLKLGIVLQLQGLNGQARPYLERAFTVRSDVCGETHPATELVCENLSFLNT